MSNLVAVAFDTPNEADKALVELRRLQKEYLIDLETRSLRAAAPMER